MFAVFAENVFDGSELNGRGDTPQMAWENMLTVFATEESDIDMETIEFFELISVNRKTKTTWVEPGDIDEDTE